MSEGFGLLDEVKIKLLYKSRSEMWKDRNRGWNEVRRFTSFFTNSLRWLKRIIFLLVEVRWYMDGL